MILRPPPSPPSARQDPFALEVLAQLPLAESFVESELTTPTGAAILATLVDQFGPLPAMTIEKIGYGAGQRDLKDQANLLRIFVGETADNMTRCRRPALSTACFLLRTGMRFCVAA